MGNMKHFLKSDFVPENQLTLQRAEEMKMVFLAVYDDFGTDKEQCTSIGLNKAEVNDLIDCLSMLHSKMK